MSGPSGGSGRSTDATGSTDGVGGSTDQPVLEIPRGDLLRSRVVSDIGTTLAAALDRDLTGYATVVPQETLLLAGDARGVLTFEAGVPVLAYNTVTDSGGPDALAELAVPGPYRVELYAVAPDALRAAHAEESLRIPPAAAATELADDPDLADRTREAAPAERLADDDGEEADAVAAFLADDDRIAAIREQARAEAEARASEWGLDDALADGGDDEPSGDDEPNDDDALADGGDDEPSGDDEPNDDDADRAERF
ncbi:hypothetical protein [Halorubrum cibi]|uniref:DUF8054 domain-containing protein n=1 Tax=Halorubrum cibi TaxID=413815 RepID=A0A521DUD3_9EURY|nr:hypothetical protein [Halorubrum cibi]SMO75317.1 hypothetical protein SAMN06264867_10839 [Halorubrum cibi]